jgi:Family of unknown function (DUF6037)
VRLFIPGWHVSDVHVKLAEGSPVPSPLWGERVERDISGREVDHMELDGLRLFHKNMMDQQLGRAAFSYTNNQARIEVVFFVDQDPYRLLIAARGVTTYAFLVDVLPGYRVRPYLGDDLKPLLDALGVRYNPSSPFSATAFFEDLDQHVPQSPSGVAPALTSTIALVQPDIEEADKTYFLCWVPQPAGRHVTSRNLQKTLALLGPDVMEQCRRGNVSSAWTDDERQENLTARSVPRTNR